MAKRCYDCLAEFGVFTWKYKCEYCGKVLCAGCIGAYRRQLPHLVKKGVEKSYRVCPHCAAKIDRKTRKKSRPSMQAP